MRNIYWEQIKEKHITNDTAFEENKMSCNFDETNISFKVGLYELRIL